MKKFKLLLLDANVVIELFRQGLWDSVVERCEIHLSRTVAECEALFWEDAHEQQHRINITPYAESGEVQIFDIPLSDLRSFRERFGPTYFDKLDPGETESLAYLDRHKNLAKVSSADKIVYRVLGNLRLTDNGISLEEILDRIGLSRSLPHQFGKAYRKKWSQRGFEEGMRGLGQKQSD
jgi:hypothetical protein